jgi:hypothetical protein
LGFSDLSPSNLVEMRIHGVTPEFIKEIRDAGYPDIKISKLIEFRIHGIDKDYIKYATDLKKGEKLPPDQIIKMKIFGI